MEILNASATQIDGERGRGGWIVNNDKGEKLYELSKELSAQQTMEAIHMARYFAKAALANGMTIAKDAHRIEVEGIMSRGQIQIDAMRAQIEGLSNELVRQMEDNEE